MEFKNGDIVTAEFEVREEPKNHPGTWAHTMGGRGGTVFDTHQISDWKLVRRALDLNKPVRFIAAERKDQKIYSVGPSAYPHCGSLIVEYLDKIGILRAEHFVISQLENIPEDEL